jgi:pyruvate/2-oxoglutarate dehydrogenase complex dihydrolipoamide dehydrogenase (E3) component
VVDPTLIDRILIPYDRLLRRGSVLQERAVRVTGEGVVLSNGDHIESDLVVVATGSRYASPFKPQGDSTRDFAETLRSINTQIRQSDRIAIVGGGAVGVELAGEVSSAKLGKVVTLISATPSLLPGYPEGLAAEVAKQLRDMGVSLQLGVRVESLQAMDSPFTGSLGQGQDGLETQLVFPALGARPVTALFQQMDGVAFDPHGRVQVDAWLRPAGAERVFALGDAAATGDPMTIVAITRQVPWLAKTLRALLDGRSLDQLPAYRPWPVRGILVPLGPRDGASLLPILRNGVQVGSWFTKVLKGRHLFIPRYHKEFGYARELQ